MCNDGKGSETVVSLRSIPAFVRRNFKLVDELYNAPLGLNIVDAFAFRRLTPPVIDISLFQSVKNCNFHATLSNSYIIGRLAYTQRGVFCCFSAKRWLARRKNSRSVGVSPASPTSP